MSPAAAAAAAARRRPYRAVALVCAALGSVSCAQEPASRKIDPVSRHDTRRAAVDAATAGARALEPVYAIEPGHWRLEATGRYYDRTEGGLGQPVVLIDRVRVRAEVDIQGAEQRVRFVFDEEEQTRRGMQPITGVIVPDPLDRARRILDATVVDPRFELRFLGDVIDPETVVGVLLGTDPNFAEKSLQGGFALQRIPDARAP